MSLIDRYIAEVGRHLPEKDRSDIQAEIRTMVEDMVDERRERSQRSSSAEEKAITETLEGLGDPQVLAAQYSPPKRYLIGPEWYEGYIQVLQRVLFTALPIFAAVTFILTLTRDPLDFVNALGEAVGGAFNVGVQILFWVTLAFVFLERSGETPDGLSKPTTRTWTITQLPQMPRTRQISIVETAIDIAMDLFLLIWIVLPLLKGASQANPASVPFLHPNLWNFWLPVFFVIMCLSLVHEVFKLRIGNWTPALTITNVILGLMWIIFITALVTTQDVINPEFLAMLDQAEGASELREVARWSINIGAAVIAGIYVWDIVHSIRMSRRFVQGR